MATRSFPLNDNVFSASFALLAEALAPATFAPSHAATAGEAPSARKPRLGFWDRVDRWAWNQMQKEREAYLAKAQNLVELELRMRSLDSGRSAFF